MSSNVRTAVERHEQGNGAPAPVSTAEVVKRMISAQASALDAVLPEHLDADRYSRLVLTAVKANPRLMSAFATQQGQVSVLLSAMQAAALGLEPNTPTQECWLQPRRAKDANNNWVDECELSIGYKGYAKLARRSGSVKTVVAGVVREGDEFDYARGLDVDTFHHKALSDDAELTHAYAIARLANGEVAWTVLTRRQVEKRRAMSESWKNDRSRPYSPWTLWTEEQWEKTAIRHLLTHGQVELSPELARAATSDEQPLRMDDDGFIDALVTDAPVAELEQSTAASDAAPEPPPVAPEDVPPPGPAVDARAIGIAATKAFPCEDAPRGQKTKHQERLRYALTFAVTNGRTVHADELTAQEASELLRQLEAIPAAEVTFAVDDDGVTFLHVATGEEVNVQWAQIEEPDHAAR